MAAPAPTESLIPSPTVSAFHLGPLTTHLYALCIPGGIALALWLGSRRWQQRGGQPGQVLDICILAIPAGITGGRIYHVITDRELCSFRVMSLTQVTNGSVSPTLTEQRCKQRRQR
jgi:prolipoprotein diacylglyceryltransferase